jgi:copper chaperone
MPQQTFSIDGLHCQGCAKTVTDALTGLPTVTAVDVDLDTTGRSKVKVEADSALSAADVQSALDAVGNFSVAS